VKLLLADKVVIVTGAAGGLGRAFAVKFAAEGAKVVCVDLADADRTAGLIRDAGGEAAVVVADVTDAMAVEAMCRSAADAYGGIDGLVNNAAISAGLKPRPFYDIDEGEWDRVMAVNAKGTWLCCKVVYPHLVRRGGGSIVNISSSSLLEGMAGLTHYIASKGAVWAMTRSIARAVGAQGVRCNSITLGFTLTEGARQGMEADPEGFKEILDHAAQARAIPRSELPEDVVGGAAFLLSDESAFITGQNLNIDGGGVHY
jgi:NAD(P)-dependent dehydrogenase (short-subunit alcohol dehydrogenase family)